MVLSVSQSSYSLEAPVRMSRRQFGLAAAGTLAASLPFVVMEAARAGSSPTAARAVDLTDPHKKDIAMQLVSSAENSSLNWRAQFKYIEDIHDGRGYTAGIIGFCTGTHDLLELVQLYA